MHAFLKERAYQLENGIVCDVRIDGYTDFVFVDRRNGVRVDETPVHDAIGEAVAKGIDEAIYAIEEYVSSAWCGDGKILKNS